MSLEIRAAGPADVETIRSLAYQIWHACYPGIISVAQIDYMLGWLYAPHKLSADITRGLVFKLAVLDGQPVGYLAHELQDDGLVLYLNMLYLRPEFHGRGFGQMMLQSALESARAAGAYEIKLRVNRHNQLALRAYERAGFSITETLCQDIGGGFVMDDFVMKRPL